MIHTPINPSNYKASLLNLNLNIFYCLIIFLTSSLYLSKAAYAVERVTNKISEISVQDDSGAIITLTKPAMRIIALAPHIVENVYSAGAGDLLVGSVNYANYPPEAEKLPRVGGYNKFNIEAIAALKPDVIFAWQSGTPDHFFEKLKQLGIPLYLDEPSTIKEIANSMRNIGKLTGRSNIAEKSAKQHLDALDKLRKTQINKSPIKVFYQVWDDPLYTINGKQIISDVIRLCGGINIYADESIKAPIISLESLIERDPDLIMTGSTHKSSDESLERWRKWSTMNAVKHNNLFIVNADIVSRHTVRIVAGAKSVCEKFDIARQNIKTP